MSLEVAIPGGERLLYHGISQSNLIPIYAAALVRFDDILASTRPKKERLVYAWKPNMCFDI